MTPCTAAACLFLAAGPVASVVEGIPYVEMTAAPEGYAVTFHNARNPRTKQPELFTVELDGIAVSGAVASRAGDDPDDMTVTPSLGWMCSPCTVTASENQSATVWLLPVVMG